MNSLSPVQKLSCWYYHRRLLPYLEGSLPGWERPLVSRHVSACPACRQDLKSFQQLTNSLRDAAPEPARPASDLWQRLESRLQAPPPTPARRITAPRVYPLALSSLSLAAIALILTFDAGYTPWGHGPVRMAAQDGSTSAPAVRAVRIAANPAHPMATANSETGAGLLVKPGTSFAAVPAHALIPKREIRPHVAAGVPDVRPGAVSQRELRRTGRTPNLREAAGPREMLRVKRSALREHAGPRYGAGEGAAARLSKQAPGPITDNMSPVRLAMAAPTLAPAVFAAPGAADLRLKMAYGANKATPGTPTQKMVVTPAASGIVGSVMLAGDRVREMDSHPDPTMEPAPPEERAIQNIQSIPAVGGAASTVTALQAASTPNVSTSATTGTSYYCQVQTLDARGEPETTSRLWGEGGPTGPLVFVQSTGASNR